MKELLKKIDESVETYEARLSRIKDKSCFTEPEDKELMDEVIKGYEEVLQRFKDIQTQAQETSKNVLQIVKCSERLPVPQSINAVGNNYYFISTKRYGEFKAMYLVDADGNAGWWLNYASKLMCEVDEWLELR